MVSPWGTLPTMPYSYGSYASPYPTAGWGQSPTAAQPNQPAKPTAQDDPAKAQADMDAYKDSLRNLPRDADDPSKSPNYGLRQGVDYASWKQCRDVVYGRIDRMMQHLHDSNPAWVRTMFGDEPGITFKEHRTDPHSHSFPYNPLAYSDAEMTWHGVDMLTPQDVDEALKDEFLSADDPRKKGYIEKQLGLLEDVYAPLRGDRRNRKV